MSPQRFDELVSDALDLIPPELAPAIDNVVVLVEDRHPDEPDLLGLYQGIALTERDSSYARRAARHDHDLPRRTAGRLRHRGRGRRRGRDHRDPRDRPPLRHRRRRACTNWAGPEPRGSRRVVGTRCYEQPMSLPVPLLPSRAGSTATARSSSMRTRGAECTEDGCDGPELIRARAAHRLRRGRLRVRPGDRAWRSEPLSPSGRRTPAPPAAACPRGSGMNGGLCWPQCTQLHRPSVIGARTTDSALAMWCSTTNDPSTPASVAAASRIAAPWLTTTMSPVHWSSSR